MASASSLVLQSDGKILVGGGITSKVNAPGGKSRGQILFDLGKIVAHAKCDHRG